MRRVAVKARSRRLPTHRDSANHIIRTAPERRQEGIRGFVDPAADICAPQSEAACTKRRHFDGHGVPEHPFELGQRS